MPRTIEDYRPGYPRFTALISAHEPFFMCRRFIKLRARILLLKQDRLSMLEQKLEQVDHEEASPLFLAKSRWDKNSERASLLSEIEASLSDYDQFTERTFQMLNLGGTCERDVESLQRWLDGTVSLAREEREYLTHRDDLASLAPTRDNAMAQIETWIEDKIVILLPSQHKDRLYNGSDDPNVYIRPGPWIQRTARAILLLVATILLLMPAIICNVIEGFLAHMLIIMVFTVLYLALLLALVSSRTMELILAGAAYAAVLIVFVSENDSVRS